MCCDYFSKVELWVWRVPEENITEADVVDYIFTKYPDVKGCYAVLELLQYVHSKAKFRELFSPFIHFGCRNFACNYFTK